MAEALSDAVTLERSLRESWASEKRLAAERDACLKRLAENDEEIMRLRETYRREREAHAANLKEQQKCEAERDRLRAALNGICSLACHEPMSAELAGRALRGAAETIAVKPTTEGD